MSFRLGWGLAREVAALAPRQDQNAFTVTFGAQADKQRHSSGDSLAPSRRHAERHSFSAKLSGESQFAHICQPVSRVISWKDCCFCVHLRGHERAPQSKTWGGNADSWKSPVQTRCDSSPQGLRQKIHCQASRKPGLPVLHLGDRL